MKKKKTTKKDLEQIGNRVKTLGEKAEAAEIQAKTLITDPETMLQKLTEIEGKRVEAVSLIWDVVKEIVGKIRETATNKTDIAKLAIAMGILTDKAQLIQGAPTNRIEWKEGSKKIGLKDRMNIYKQLAAKKVGRPVGGQKPNE